MEQARRNAAKSLNSAKMVNAFKGSVPTGFGLATEIPSQSTANASTSAESCITAHKREYDIVLEKLSHEMDRLKSQAQSIEKENEILRGLLSSEQAKPASTFRRAILMRLCPEEVVNVIGVHDRNDAIFVAVEATLFNSKSLPIQKVSTSFSDGRWQEEMKFILDTESKWIDGRFVLELRQKMFASSEDPVIGTASISPRRCLDWLHEGGEHSVQIEMARAAGALKGEHVSTILFFTVKVAAERLFSNQNFNADAAAKSIVDEVDPQYFNAIESNDKKEGETEISVNAALPGVPHESESASVVAPDLYRSDSVFNENSKDEPHEVVVTEAKTINFKTAAIQVSLLARWKRGTIKKASFETSAQESASSTDDEEEKSKDAANTSSTVSIPTRSSRKLELAPNSNRSSSSEFVDSRASRLSFNSMVHQKKAFSSKVILAPVLDESKRLSQINILKSLDSDLAANNADLHKAHEQRLQAETDNAATKQLTDASKANTSIEMLNEELIIPTPGLDPNFVATIKGVSFANQRLLAIIKKNRTEALLVVDNQNSHSSVIQADPLLLASAKLAEASTQPGEEIDRNSATGCWSKIGSTLKLWFAAAKSLCKLVLARFRIRERNATVRPIHETLDVESEIEAMNMAEARRLKVYNTQLAAKKLMEDIGTAEDETAPSVTIPNHDDDIVETKLVLAISHLKVAFFDLPRRGKGVKVTPVAAIAQVMKSLSTGNSTAHQRFSAIQHYLQSKWIDCESMEHIMAWIKSPPEQVKFFECMAMRVIDKKGLAKIACKFIHKVGTKFVALKTVERLLMMSNKDSSILAQRKASDVQIDEEDGDGQEPF